MSTENVTSTDEISSDAKSTTEVLDHASDENTEQKDMPQEGTEEFQSISRDTILDVNGRNEEQLSDTSGQHIRALFYSENVVTMRALADKRYRPFV